MQIVDYAGAGRDSCRDLADRSRLLGPLISRCLYLYIHIQQRFLHPTAFSFSFCMSAGLAHREQTRSSSKFWRVMVPTTSGCSAPVSAWMPDTSSPDQPNYVIFHLATHPSTLHINPEFFPSTAPPTIAQLSNPTPTTPPLKQVRKLKVHQPGPKNPARSMNTPFRSPKNSGESIGT